MKIARYWTRGDGEAWTSKGERIRATARGWSDESIDAARAVASGIARRVAERIAAGSSGQRYPYGDRPLPEPLIREFSSGQGIVTRNAYGALVLNAARLLFADIDGQPAGAGLGNIFSGLFGKPKSDPLVERVKAITERHGRKARLYRTAAGYRLMIVDAPYRPGDAETESLLEEYKADPLYRRLCRTQESFRARLTPKPWRCGMLNPPAEFPFETTIAREQFAVWEREYNAKTQRFATCKLVAEVGSGRPAEEFRELIDYHDRETKAGQELPLA